VHATGTPSFHAGFAGVFSLCVFDEFFDTLSVGFGMAVAADGIAAAGRFDQDIGPDEACSDVNGSDFGDAHAFLILAEKGSLAARDGFIADLDVGRKEEVAFSPTAGFEGLERHELK